MREWLPIPAWDPAPGRVACLQKGASSTCMSNGFLVEDEFAP